MPKKNRLNWCDMAVLVLLAAMLQPFWQHFVLTKSAPFYTWVLAHAVHVNWTHFALDMACACLLPVLVPGISRRLFWVAVLLLSISISALLLGFNQLQAASVSGYVGISGVLHGLYFLFPALFLVGYLRQKRAGQTQLAQQSYFFWQALLLSLGTCAKVAYDWLVRPEHAAELIGVPVVHAAHLDGLLVALVFFVLLILANFVKSGVIKP